MAESCMNELGIAADELRANAEIPLVEGEQLTLEETAYREMRTKLDNMGPVNMMALEEFKETEQRHQFLETQRKDLLESIENTQATIKEIDEFSRQKFQEAFERINENFQFTFRKLFGGGQAFMRLTDELNTAESGIDVVASPPGKKLQNVLLLSGGEKALTALSLLVGIFQYQPSPFCILDEVDAPLDEANIGRFTELIKEMAVQTQFILITHSKKTMSIAPVMYGVTMQEPGVSKIVSVKFGVESDVAAGGFGLAIQEQLHASPQPHYLWIVLLAGLPCASATNTPQADKIVIVKSTRTMTLLSGDKILKTYKVALGTVPVGPKRVEGDHKTPEGNYVIDSKNPQSQFHMALHISYPSAADRAKSTANCSASRRGHHDPWPGQAVCLPGTAAPANRLDGWMRRSHQCGDRRDMEAGSRGDTGGNTAVAAHDRKKQNLCNTEERRSGGFNQLPGSRLHSGS